MPWILNSHYKEIEMDMELQGKIILKKCYLDAFILIYS